MKQQRSGYLIVRTPFLRIQSFRPVGGAPNVTVSSEVFVRTHEGMSKVGYSRIFLDINIRAVNLCYSSRVLLSYATSIVTEVRPTHITGSVVKTVVPPRGRSTTYF